jgi:hypothetical protein
MSHYEAATESHTLAETGVNVGLAKFYSDTSWFGTISQTFNGGDGPTGHLKGSFTATMTNMGGGVARLRSESSYPVSPSEVYHDTVEVFFNTGKTNGFTLYAYLTGFEGNDDFWVDGDTLWGKAHTNGRLHINGKPVFKEKVTATKGFDPGPGKGTNKAVFQNGYETGVAAVEFPANLNELFNAANPAMGGQGRYYTTDIYVTLNKGTSANNDGSALVRLTQTGPIVDSIPITGAGFNGALVTTQNAYIKGTLDGSLTIGSSQNILVQDNLLYQNRNFKTTDDVLGIVADGSVIVAHTTPNNTDCLIDGSIFARTGSFYTEDINTGSTRGRLTTHGSIVQATRGKLGIYSGKTLNKGYATSFYYDPRLANPAFRPPFYPGYWVTTYAITNWWESVRIPNINY